jgi:sugar transferase (PEP-CTERM/EpsH1 system associated)
MKLCMVVSRVPWPLEKGDKLRAYHQLRVLAQKNEVHLFCLSDSAVDVAAVEYLKTITPHVVVYRLSKWKMLLRMLFAFFSRKPFQVHYFFDRSVASRMRKAVDTIRPDAVYCQLIRCSEYVKHWHHYHKVLDYMDALSAGQQRRAKRSPWYLTPFVREEAKRLAAYEHLIFDYFERHCIISNQDRELIYHPSNWLIRIVPNGIDTDYFKAVHNNNPKYDVLFTGNMSYPPNVEGAQRLVRSVLPIVHARNPNVRVLLAGANPGSAVKSLASSSVDVSGWMDDMRKAYADARIFVAPMLSGSGMQNKLLEAMSMELPCITTSLAALPIGLKHGETSWIGNSDEEIAEAILRLMDASEEADRIAKSGRQYVLENYNWEASVHELELTCFPHID